MLLVWGEEMSDIWEKARGTAGTSEQGQAATLGIKIGGGNPRARPVEWGKLRPGTQGAFVESS